MKLQFWGNCPLDVFVFIFFPILYKLIKSFAVFHLPFVPEFKARTSMTRMHFSWKLGTLWGSKVDTSADNTLRDTWHAKATCLQITTQSVPSCLLVALCFLRLPKVGVVCHRLQQRTTHTCESSADHQQYKKPGSSWLPSLGGALFLWLCVGSGFFLVALVLFTDLCPPCVLQSELPRQLLFRCLIYHLYV